MSKVSVTENLEKYSSREETEDERSINKLAFPLFLTLYLYVLNIRAGIPLDFSTLVFDAIPFILLSAIFFFNKFVDKNILYEKYGQIVPIIFRSAELLAVLMFLLWIDHFTNKMIIVWNQ